MSTHFVIKYFLHFLLKYKKNKERFDSLFISPIFKETVDCKPFFLVSYLLSLAIYSNQLFKIVYIFPKVQELRIRIRETTIKKWKKIEEKPPEKHTNSLKTADNSPNSYSTESHQQKKGSS